jgi:outer membrane beta-barrel protein
MLQPPAPAHRRILSLLFCAALLLSFSSPAFADDSDGLTADETLQEEALSAKRAIKTLQRRLFAKFGRLEFSITSGIIPNDPFIFYIPSGLRIGYHFNEALALELSSAYLGAGLRAESDLRTQLDTQKVERTRVSSIKLLDQQVVRTDLGVMWSPIFGKVAVMNNGLVHFDFNVVGGLGYLLTESENERLETEYGHTLEGFVGAGFKFYFLGRFAVRADFRQYLYGKKNGGVANPSEISLGFSVFTDPL